MALLAAAVVIVALFSLGRNDSGPGDSVAGQTADVQIDGEPLVAMPQPVRVSTQANDPAVGQVAPSLSGTDFDGAALTIAADGVPKVVYFLAHWCPHCQAEVPVVQDLLDGGEAPAELQIYAVSTAVAGGRGNYPPQDWLEAEGFTPPTLRDDASSSALVAFGAGAFPYAVYLDGDNRVVSRSKGSVSAGEMLDLWTLTARS